jgi:hypothetical protein
MMWGGSPDRRRPYVRAILASVRLPYLTPMLATTGVPVRDPAARACE